MSKVIVKANYHNPRGATKSVSGYAEYIATREGVELRNQDMDRPPDTTYADYIATRPGVETRGAHGLFSIEDRPISLPDVSNELKGYKGNVWTVVVSLKREDADAKGYNNSEAWRELITDKADEIAKAFNIHINHLNCYAAYHDSDTHPHIHMMIYSEDPSKDSGFLKASSLQHLKSVFTREIFQEELSEIYRSKTDLRDSLKTEVADRIRELANNVQENKNGSPDIVSKFNELVQSLNVLEGKKVYGYLPEDLKEKVDDILRDICSDPRIQELYDKWYELKGMQQEYYNSNEVIKIPIEKNEEFKSVRNAIVKEASRIKPKMIFNKQTDTSQASTVALNDVLDLLCQVFVSGADENDLTQSDEETIIEIQEELDRALGIKHY